MITKARVAILLSTLLILSGCVFNKKENENIILQIAASDESRELTLKNSNYTQEYEVSEEAIVGTKLSGVVYKAASDNSGIPWLASKIQDASDARVEVTLVHTYNQFDEKISTITLPGSEKITDATGVIYEYGKNPSIGAVWFPNRVTRYGYDCAGCSVVPDDYSGTASGIKLGKDRVRQLDGSWKNGLTYNGYHIIATSTAIPLCTVVKVSNHPFSGGGISAGVPFYAIVGDRGVGGSSIDLFAGTETNLNVISQSTSPTGSNTKVEIVGFNSRIRTSNGLTCGN